MSIVTNPAFYEDVQLFYDSIMYRLSDSAYYGQSDFYNYGYWLEGTKSQEEACENLMEKLLTFIPEKRGSILDVACGLGATSRHLLKYYNASDVVGINISAKQLETSKINAPGCRFILMDATRLAFAESGFENIICIESAFHFQTREQFLHEAYRVLKPGGYLVSSDIIFSRVPGIRYRYVPKENFIKNLEDYRALYLRAGFQQVEVIDATNECWRGFRYNLIRCACKRFLAREMEVRDFSKGVLWLLVLTAILRHYLLVSAKKV